VILRAQSLFSTKSGIGPVAGVWLYEAPWQTVVSQAASASDLIVTQEAHLNGFTLAKAKGRPAELARLVFPRRRSLATEMEIVALALQEDQAVTRNIGGFDLFGERDFFLAAEPLFVRRAPWRVLLAAVRKDSLDLVGPWMERLGVLTTA
jgi:hypothetical protein